MSADNFYLIRQNPAGGFSAVMGFESAEELPAVPVKAPSFSTIDGAVESVMDEYTEYGIRIHPECRFDLI